MATTKVTTGGITDATITTADIADDAITLAKMASDTVSASQIINNAVTVNALAADAVTTPKIGDQQVTLAKLEHGTSSNDGKFLRANNGADPTFETVTSTTINNNADNRVITGSGTANTLNAKANVVIDSSSRFIVGPGQASRSVGDVAAQMQVEGQGFASSSFSLISNAGASAGNTPHITMGKSRGSSVGSNTIVADGDALGQFQFAGADGTDCNSVAASIIGRVDGTPGSNDMPGALTFGTAADGAASPTERMRIDSSGKVGIGTTSPSRTISAHVSDSGANYIHLTNTGTGTGDANGTFIGLDAAEGALIWNQEDNYIRFGTNNAERMRITSDGKVGIDVAGHDPLTKLHVQDGNNGALVDVFTITNENGTSGTAVGMVFECGTDEVARISAANTGSDIGPLMFATASSSTANPSEKMRITSGGRLLVHTTTDYNGYLSSYAESGQPYPIAAIGGNTSQGLIGLYYSTSLIGSITVTGGGSSVAYNTSSDYRLKENVVDLSNGIARLKTLIPRRFNWKDDKSTTVDGFVAHEVTAVPEAVTGTKDQVVTEDNEETGDKKGDPIYQQIDQSKLVPLLTAALQEAVAKIEVLETKVAALEAA